MRRLFVRLSVSLLTFLVGVLAATLWVSCPERSTAGPPPPQTEVLITTADPLPMFYAPTYCTSRIPAETPEQKAVRLAEEFVARNGYTDLPPDREHISYETVEWESDLDEMLKSRHDTLARKAYGIRYDGRLGGPGWMVAFKPSPRFGNVSVDVGRVVTMDKNFENLRMEHKSFPLANVHKRF